MPHEPNIVTAASSTKHQWITYLFEIIAEQPFGEQLRTLVDLAKLQANSIWYERARQPGALSTRYDVLDAVARRLQSLNGSKGATSNAKVVRASYNRWVAGSHTPDHMHWKALTDVLFGDDYDLIPLKRMLECGYRVARGEAQSLEQREREIAAGKRLLGIVNPEIQFDVQLRCNRITDPDGEELFAVYRMQEEKFKGRPEVMDSYPDMRRWLEEGLTGNSEVDEFTLALTLGESVVGYLQATNYSRIGIAFVGYVAVLTRWLRLRQEAAGTKLLLETLIEEVNARSPLWNVIVGEVETDPVGETHRKDDALFDVFGRHAGKARSTTRSSARLFLLPIDYWQPVLRPNLVGTEHETSVHLAQRLVLYVRNPAQYLIERDGSYFISAARLKSVVSALYGRWYGENHPSSKRYQEHLSQLASRVLAQIGAEPIGLLHVR